MYLCFFLAQVTISLVRLRWPYLAPHSVHCLHTSDESGRKIILFSTYLAMIIGVASYIRGINDEEACHLLEMTHHVFKVAG